MILGNTQVQAGTAQVSTRLHTGYTVEIQASAVVPPGQGVEHGLFQAQLLDQRWRQAGQAALGIVRRRHECNGKFHQRIAIDVYQQVVLARHDEIGRGKYAQVQVLAILEVQYIRIELEFFGRTCPRRSAAQCSGSQYLCVIHVTKSLSDTA